MLARVASWIPPHDVQRRGLRAALIGRLLALRIVAKVSHPSLIAFVLSGVLAAALGLLGVQAR